MTNSTSAFSLSVATLRRAAFVAVLLGTTAMAAVPAHATDAGEGAAFRTSDANDAGEGASFRVSGAGDAGEGADYPTS